MRDPVRLETLNSALATTCDEMGITAVRYRFRKKTFQTPRKYTDQGSLLRKDRLMIITLTPDIERASTAEAHRRGRTPEQVALESLRERFVAPGGEISLAETQDTLADFLRGYVGVLHSSEHIPGGARMSEDSGRKFAAGLAAQRQQQQS